MAVNPGSLESHQKWDEANKFGFPICVDEEKKVAAAYGALGLLGGVQRCVILLEKKGTVAWVQEGLPSTEEILAAIDEMKHDDSDGTRLSSS